MLMNEREINTFEDLLKLFLERSISDYNEWEEISIGLYGKSGRYRAKLIKKIKEIFLQKENTNVFKITDTKELFENKDLFKPLIHLCVLQDSAEKMHSYTHAKQVSSLITLRHRLNEIRENGVLYLLFNIIHLKYLDKYLRATLSLVIRTDLSIRTTLSHEDPKTYKFLSIGTLTGRYMLFNKENLKRLPDEAIEVFLKKLINRAYEFQSKNPLVRIFAMEPKDPFEHQNLLNFLKEEEIQYFIELLKLNRGYKKLYE